MRLGVSVVLGRVIHLHCLHSGGLWNSNWSVVEKSKRPNAKYLKGIIENQYIPARKTLNMIEIFVISHSDV